MKLEEPKIIEKFQCQSCMKLHDSGSSAKDCCAPVAVYLCSICGDEFPYDDEQDLKEHIALPHKSTGVVDEEDVAEEIYVELLLEGLPPLPAHEIAEKKAAELCPI